MLQTFNYKKIIFGEKLVQKRTNAGFDLGTSNNFSDTWRMYEKSLHVSFGRATNERVEVTRTTPNGNKNYVPGPLYKLQENKKNYIIRLKLQLQNKNKNTCQQYKTYRIWYITKMRRFMLTWYILWCQKMENKRRKSKISQP